MDFDKLKDYLIKKYNCHTLILYGSFAKGDFDDTSDVDVIGFTADDIEAQDKSLFEGRTLDCWVYNERKMAIQRTFFIYARAKCF